jgi:hypothetical protein
VNLAVYLRVGEPDGEDGQVESGDHVYQNDGSDDECFVKRGHQPPLLAITARLSLAEVEQAGAEVSATNVTKLLPSFRAFSSPVAYSTGRSREPGGSRAPRRLATIGTGFAKDSLETRWDT